MLSACMGGWVVGWGVVPIILHTRTHAPKCPESCARLQVDGCTDGRTDGRTDGPTDGRTNVRMCTRVAVTQPAIDCATSRGVESNFEQEQGTLSIDSLSLWIDLPLPLHQFD